LTNWVIGITGGAGYVGTSLAKHFATSFDVKLLDIRKPSQNLQENISFQKCDVRDYEEVKDAVKDVDLVIHTSIIQIPAITEQKKLAYEVNFIGTQNVCRAVEESERVKGLILCGSWHTIGERELKGVIDEEFGFRPDKVESRARLYALSKMTQEAVVRFYDEMSEKVFGIIRMGTVLGEGMPEKTAASIFIENGLQGKPLTPFKHSMFRPMLYVGIDDVCSAYEKFARKILENNIKKDGNSLTHIFNVYYPEAITILELAEIVRASVKKYTKGSINPYIEIVDTNQPSLFNKDDKEQIKVDVNKALTFLQLERIRSPKELIANLVKRKGDGVTNPTKGYHNLRPITPT
jgi:nucleoside-diphosphate-sugar epimerase